MPASPADASPRAEDYIPAAVVELAGAGYPFAAPAGSASAYRSPTPDTPRSLVRIR